MEYISLNKEIIRLTKEFGAMVAKITSGVSVYGALYYNQEKVDKGKARTLAWNRIMERPDGTAGIPERCAA